jgi:hypothetical protein
MILNIVMMQERIRSRVFIGAASAILVADAENGAKSEERLPLANKKPLVHF